MYTKSILYTPAGIVSLARMEPSLFKKARYILLALAVSRTTKYMLDAGERIGSPEIILPQAAMGTVVVISVLINTRWPILKTLPPAFIDTPDSGVRLPVIFIAMLSSVVKHLCSLL